MESSNKTEAVQELSNSFRQALDFFSRDYRLCKMMFILYFSHSNWGGGGGGVMELLIVLRFSASLLAGRTTGGNNQLPTGPGQ